MQQRRLARARRAHDGGELPRARSTLTPRRASTAASPSPYTLRSSTARAAAERVDAGRCGHLSHGSSTSRSAGNLPSGQPSAHPQRVTVPCRIRRRSCCAAGATASFPDRWARQVLNLRPLACEASALPLSYAPDRFGSVATRDDPSWWDGTRRPSKVTAARARVVPPSSPGPRARTFFSFPVGCPAESVSRRHDNCKVESYMDLGHRQRSVASEGATHGRRSRDRSVQTSGTVEAQMGCRGLERLGSRSAVRAPRPAASPCRRSCRPERSREHS